MIKTPTEIWIENDQPLFDFGYEELVEALLIEGHDIDYAVKLVNTLLPDND